MIKLIEISNFKSIVNLNIELNKLTVLSGMNSSGKSSTIQALRILQLAEKQSNFDAYSDSDMPLERLDDHGSYRDLFSEIGNNGRKQISFNVFENGESSNKISLEIELNGNYKYIDVNSEAREESVFDIEYISADRLGPKVFLNDKPRIGDIQIGNNGENSFSFLAHNYAKIINKPLVKNSKSLRLAVDEWMSKISPNCEIIANSQIKLDIATLEINGFRPTNVGFGISYTLPIVMALLYFGNNPQKILCIENPEAHLHPQAQTYMGMLIAACAASGTQVVIETHSDHLLDGIRLAVKNGVLNSEKTTIHYFELLNGASFVESPKIDKNGKIDFWPEGFFDQFTVNGKELL